jgi:hypothetical protein
VLKYWRIKWKRNEAEEKAIVQSCPKKKNNLSQDIKSFIPLYYVKNHDFKKSLKLLKAHVRFQNVFSLWTQFKKGKRKGNVGKRKYKA